MKKSGVGVGADVVVNVGVGVDVVADVVADVGVGVVAEKPNRNKLLRIFCCSKIENQKFRKKRFFISEEKIFQTYFLLFRRLIA